MVSDTKLTVKVATDAKTPANSTFPQLESDGKRPGTGFGPKTGKRNQAYFSYPSDLGNNFLNICTSMPVGGHCTQKSPALQAIAKFYAGAERVRVPLTIIQRADF